MCQVWYSGPEEEECNFFLLFRLYLFLDEGKERRMPSLAKIGLMILEMSVFKICVQ